MVAISCSEQRCMRGAAAAAWFLPPESFNAGIRLPDDSILWIYGGVDFLQCGGAGALVQRSSSSSSLAVVDGGAWICSQRRRSRRSVSLDPLGGGCAVATPATGWREQRLLFLPRFSGDVNGSHLTRFRRQWSNQQLRRPLLLLLPRRRRRRAGTLRGGGATAARRGVWICLISGGEQQQELQIWAAAFDRDGGCAMEKAVRGRPLGGASPVIHGILIPGFRAAAAE